MTFDPATVRIGREERQWLSFIASAPKIYSLPVEARLRDLAKKFPRLIAVEQAEFPRVYSLTDDGRAVLAAARQRANHRQAGTTTRSLSAPSAISAVKNSAPNPSAPSA